MNPLILLHGALGAKTQLEPLKNILEASFDVHSLSFSGHGGQPPQDTGYNMHQFSNDVQHYMEANGIETADIFGYSMGGYVALKLALVKPEKVGRIMTLGTKFDWSAASAAKEMNMLNPDAILTKVPKFAQMLEQRHHPLDWREVLRLTAAMMHALGNGEALQLSDFAKVKHPVLLSVGAADNMVSVAESLNVANVLPNGNFKQLEGLPHPIEKVDLELLKTEILNFFNNKLQKEGK